MLLEEVSKIAQSPMDRFSNDLKEAQKAKVLAFEVLGNMRSSMAVDRSANIAMRMLCWCYGIGLFLAQPPCFSCRGAEQAAAPHNCQGEQPVWTEGNVQALNARATAQIELVQVRCMPCHLQGEDCNERSCRGLHIVLADTVTHPWHVGLHDGARFECCDRRLFYRSAEAMPWQSAMEMLVS
jgi:hypothetical protein